MDVQNLGISYWAGVATRITARSANVADWRIRSRKNKALRDLAREWAEGKGYIIATEEQMFATYHWRLTHKVNPNIKDKKLHIWAVDRSIPDQWGRVALSIIQIC